MTNVEHLVEQHIREYESRAKHFDELADKVREKSTDASERAAIRKQLEELTAERDRLMVRVDEFRLKSLDNWRVEEIERAGPMGVWDALAQQLEALVERLER